MNERAMTKHSVNCYFCGQLADERECLPADDFNNGDGGTICGYCEQNFKFKIIHDTLCDGWIDFEHDEANNPILYCTREEAQAEINDFMEEFGQCDEDGDGGYDEDEFEIVAVRISDDGKAEENI